VSKDKEIIAYHEAGHAVAAYILRRRFHYVTVKPEGDAGGHMREVLIPSMAKWTDSLGWPERYRARLEKQAMISLAGAVALELITGDPQWLRASKDQDQAIDMVMALSEGSADEAGPYCDWLTARVRSLLGQAHYLRAIKALAYSLLIEETVDYRNARIIIEKAAGITSLEVPYEQAEEAALTFVDELRKEANVKGGPPFIQKGKMMKKDKDVRSEITVHRCGVACQVCHPGSEMTVRR
jgi:Peptidase family M41